MGSFLGIPNRAVEEEPGWGSFVEGLKRAYGMAPAQPPGPGPSRGTVQDLARSHGDEDPKDRDKALREEFARNQAKRNAEGEDPRNIRQTDTRVPSDPKRDAVGTGTDLQPLESHSPSTPESRADALEGDGLGQAD